MKLLIVAASVDDNRCANLTSHVGEFESLADAVKFGWWLIGHEFPSNDGWHGPVFRIYDQDFKMLREV